MTYGARPPAPCMVCGDPKSRHFQTVIDGVPLRLQPFLCAEHGDEYLLRVGRALGEMMMAEAGRQGARKSGPH